MRLPHVGSGRTRPVTVVFDIGSGSAAAGILVSSGPDESAQLRASTRVMLTQEERSDAQRADGIARCVREAGEQVMKAYERDKGSHGPIEHVVAVIHAPWVTSASARSEETMKEPTRVTDGLVREVARRALSKQEKPSALAERDVFEHTVTRIELNGYVTSAPSGKEAEHVCVTVIQSGIDAAFKKRVEAAINALLPGRDVRMRSATLMYSSVLRELSGAPVDYTILDMTSEATACTAIRAGDITEHAVASAGMRSVLRDVARETKTEPEAARSLIRMAKDDTCSDEACEKARTALAEAEKKLIRQLGEAFSTMAEVRRIPNTLVCAVHPDMVDWARDFFSRLDFNQFTITGRPFVPRQLTAASLTDYVVFAPGNRPDAGLAVAGAFAHITMDG